MSGLFGRPYTQIALSIALSAVAQLLLKRGAGEGTGAFGLGGLHSPWVWGGIAAMISSLLSWLYALRFVPVGLASNLTGAIHVLVPLGCWGWLGETISARRWLGIALVIAGVIVSARPAASVEEKL
jgi:drug/metabolite transporter (DMT)-like permease